MKKMKLKKPLKVQLKMLLKKDMIKKWKSKLKMIKQLTKAPL